MYLDSSQAFVCRSLSRNAAENPAESLVKTVRDDAFDALKGFPAQGARFDVVILDPPAFIKRKKDIPQGQAAYRKLNQLALDLIEGRRVAGVPARALTTWAPDELVRVPSSSAARHTGRFVQILESGGQSPDHPVHPAIPETRYLKAFFCRVTRSELG